MIKKHKLGKELIYFLLVFLLVPNILAITYLNQGECQEFVLANNFTTNTTEKVCSKDFVNTNLTCSPNISLSCPEVRFNLSIPSCPASPNVTTICTPVNNVDLKTGGSMIYGDLKSNTSYVLYTILVIFLGIILYKFSDKIVDSISRKKYYEPLQNPGRIKEEINIKPVSKTGGISSDPLFKGLDSLGKL